jgi:flagellar protein FliJ
MTRSKRMQPVARVANDRQQNAARQVGERQRELEAQLNRLDELSNYRSEYARRFDEGTESMTGMNVRDYRLFLSRLNQAIEEQARRVEQARRELERSHGNWSATRVHSDAIHKVMDRFQKEEQRQEARREQVREDEFGQRPRKRDE